MIQNRSRGMLVALALLMASAPALMVGCSSSSSSPATPSTPGDTTAPTVVITGASVTPVSAPVTLTFAFSEDIGSSFTASDVAVTPAGVAAASVTKVDATHYTLVLTPPSNASGNIQVNVAVGAFSDLASNANTATASATQPYNTVVAPPSYPVVDFNTAGLTYKPTDFGGTVSTFPAVGAPAGGPATPVVKVIRTSGAATWGGTTLSVGYLDSVGTMPFSATHTQLTALVYSPAAGVAFRLKAEDANDTTHSVEAEVNAVMGWQTLTFDMATQAGGTAPLNLAYIYNKISIFPHFGVVPSSDETYYVGPIKFIGAAAPTAPPLSAPVDTTPPTVVIGGTSASAITGPVTLTFTFSEDVGTTFNASDVVVTPAGVAAASVTKIDATHYTLLVTPPSNAVGNVQVGIAIGAFMDLASNANTVGANATQAYNTTAPALSYAVVDFNTAGLTYKGTDFGGTASVFPAVGAPAGGPATPVMQVKKIAGAQTWGGTTVSVGYLDSVGTMPFSASHTQLTAVVYSPAAGVSMKLKAEDAKIPANSVETDAVTVAGWQTLTFNMANNSTSTAALNLAFTYNKISIFPNFGVVPSADETYFVGPITFLGASSPSAPPLTAPVVSGFTTVTFDAAGTTYGNVDFGGTASLLDPGPAGSNGQVLKVTKTVGAEAWAGTTLGDSGTALRPQVGTMALTTSRSKFTVRVYSPAIGINILLKAEDVADPTKSVETQTSTTAVGWQTLTFDFATQRAGTGALNPAYTYNMLSVFPDFNAAGIVEATALTFYFDDFTFLP